MCWRVVRCQVSQRLVGRYQGMYRMSRPELVAIALVFGVCGRADCRQGTCQTLQPYFQCEFDSSGAAGGGNTIAIAKGPPQDIVVRISLEFPSHRDNGSDPTFFLAADVLTAVESLRPEKEEDVFVLQSLHSLDCKQQCLSNGQSDVGSPGMSIRWNIDGEKKQHGTSGSHLELRRLVLSASFASGWVCPFSAFGVVRSSKLPNSQRHTQRMSQSCRRSHQWTFKFWPCKSCCFSWWDMWQTFQHLHRRTCGMTVISAICWCTHGPAKMNRCSIGTILEAPHRGHTPRDRRFYAHLWKRCKQQSARSKKQFMLAFRAFHRCLSLFGTVKTLGLCRCIFVHTLWRCRTMWWDGVGTRNFASQCFSHFMRYFPSCATTSCSFCWWKVARLRMS